MPANRNRAHGKSQPQAMKEATQIQGGTKLPTGDEKRAHEMQNEDPIRKSGGREEEDVLRSVLVRSGAWPAQERMPPAPSGADSFCVALCLAQGCFETVRTGRSDDEESLANRRFASETPLCSIPESQNGIRTGSLQAKTCQRTKRPERHIWKKVADKNRCGRALKTKNSYVI